MVMIFIENIIAYLRKLKKGAMRLEGVLFMGINKVRKKAMIG